MKKMTCVAVLAFSAAVFSVSSQAADVAPEPSLDPVVQHLNLNTEQVQKIKKLHEVMINNVQQISRKDVKEGALIDVIQSGKWSEKAVKEQLSAFSQVDQQVRYYRVKYYFDVNQVLTPAQRKQVRDDLAQAAAKNG